MKDRQVESSGVHPDKPNRPLSDLSREELYEFVWAKPVTAVAEDFEVSDVAIAKHCKKHEVPIPSRGYWAKKRAGKNPRKEPLPPSKAEVFLKAAEKPLRKTLALPTNGTAFHPVAIELMAAIRSEHVDSDKRVRVRKPSIPEVDVTKALAERTAAAFHVILTQSESLNIFFRKSQSSYSGGHFRRGQDRLYLKIEENLIEKAQTNGNRRVYASWQRQPELKVPSGRLAFSLSTERWSYRDIKRWGEEEKSPLEAILAQIVAEIRRHFAETHKQRVKDAIERQKQHVEWERRHQEYLLADAIRRQKEREENHFKALTSVKREREEALLKAVELWHRHGHAVEFLAACERQWRGTQADNLTKEQDEWLQWARALICGLSPFKWGYPDPFRDGEFNAEAVPVGGPYPEARKFSL